MLEDEHRNHLHETEITEEYPIWPKQPLPTMDIKGVVYQIPCSSCPAAYTGETGRTLKVRMAEHKRAVRMGDVNNGLAVHSLKTGHPIE